MYTIVLYTKFLIKTHKFWDQNYSDTLYGEIMSVPNTRELLPHSSNVINAKYKLLFLAGANGRYSVSYIMSVNVSK